MDNYIEKYLDNYQQMAHYRIPHDSTMQECIQAGKRKQIKLLVEVLEERRLYLNVKRAMQSLGWGIGNIKGVSNKLL